MVRAMSSSLRFMSLGYVTGIPSGSTIRLSINPYVHRIESYLEPVSKTRVSFFPPFFSFLFFSFLVFLVSMTRFPSGGSPRGRANGGTISIEIRRIRVARILFGDGFKISSWLNGIRRRLAWRRTCVIRGNCTRRDLGRYF